jgi:ribosomal-protein-alanine N-acetyltransferase
LSPTHVFLEAAGEEDLGVLCELESRCFANPWTPAQLRDEMAEPSRGGVLILRAPLEERVGCRGLVAYCAFRLVADEFHLHNLAVSPDFRGRRLGQRLLRLALGLGRRRGAATAHLEVRRSNTPAIALYTSEGFEVVGVRRGYYRLPEEDALLMSIERLSSRAASPPQVDP